VLIVLIVSAVAAVRFAVRVVPSERIVYGVGIQVRELERLYGKTQALYDIQLAVGGQPRHGIDWTLGLRQVYIHSLPEPMHETIPEAGHGERAHRRD